MLCKSYFTYKHYDFKHVLFDNSVFCSAFRNKALRGWCFFYVCASGGLFWGRQLFCLLFRISKMEKLLDKFKCWDSTSCFWGLISSPLGWLLSQFGDLALRNICFLSGVLCFTRLCCCCSPSPCGGIICSKLNGSKLGTIILSLCLQHQRNWEFISQKDSGWPLAAQELALSIKEEDHGLYNTILGGRGCIQHLSLSFLSPVCNVHVSKVNWFLQHWQPHHCTDLHNTNIDKWTKEELKI